MSLKHTDHTSSHVEISKNDKRLGRRMLRYIERDKFKRFKDILKEYKIHPDSIVATRTKRTLLHECALNGAVECMRIILNDVSPKANPKVKDSKGNYPLHLAIKFTLKQKTFSQGLVDDLVEPLKREMFDLLHDANNSGTTCWHLLQGLHVKKDLFGNRERSSSDDSSDTSGDVANKETAAAEWNEKLNAIGGEEYYSTFGKFDYAEEKCFENEFKETFDQWADRIYREYSKRHHQRNVANQPHLSRPAEKSSSARSGDGEKGNTGFRNVNLPPFKPIYEKRKDDTIAKYRKLFLLGKSDQLTKTDLPFSLNSTADEIISLVLRCNSASNQISEGAEHEHKQQKVIREAIRKWHPDKFAQMFQNHFTTVDNSKDFSDVMKIVTHVSQTLLLYGK